MSSQKRLVLPLCVCLLGIVLVGGSFVLAVLSRPAKTPILTLTGTYGPEWDLNAWVAEDLDSINGLAKHTCAVAALPSADQLAAGFWDSTDDLLRNSLASCDEQTPLLVYVNLHGAVNDSGAACWIPPSAQVNDASTWFPIESFLDHIAQAQQSESHQPVVLLLECGRLRTHWSSGIAENEFDAKLGELAGLHQRKYPKSDLTILNATSEGERSLYSRLGDGDVFTRSLVEGLSGQADGFGTSSTKDGIVDSDELHHFVHRRVRRWAEQHRGSGQTPTLHRPHSAGPVPLVRVCPQHALELPSTPPPSKIETEKLRDAAKLVTQLEKRDAISVNSHAWSQIRCTLHAIEQSIYGGVAARKSTDRWLSRLNRQAQKLKQQMRERESESSQLADVQLNRQAEIVWSALAKQATRTTAVDLIREVGGEKTMPVPMLHALLQQPGLSVWEDADIIKRMATTQAQWLKTTITLPDAIFPAAEQVCHPVHEKRRYLADTILANPGPESLSPNAPIDLALRQFENEVTKRTSMLADLVRAWRLRERAFLELPYLYQSVEDGAFHGKGSASHAARHDHPDTDGNHTFAANDDPHAEQKVGIADVMQLDSLLRDFVAETISWDDAMHDRVTVATQNVMGYLDEMSHSHGSAARWGTVKAKGADSSMMRTLDADQMMRSEEQMRRIDEATAKVLQEDHDADDHGHGNGNQDAPASEAIALSKAKDRHADKEDVHSARPEYLAIMLGLDPESVNAAKIRRQLREFAHASEHPSENCPWRRAISLIIDDGFTQVIDAARKQARQRRLASRASEVLDDFWNAPASDGIPYCLATAQSLMANADSLMGTTASWQTRRRDLQNELQSRQDAARDGLAVQANWQPSYTRSDLTNVSVDVRRTGSGSGIPDGIGFVTIRRSDQSTIDAQQPISLKPCDNDSPASSPSLSPALSLAIASKSTSDALAEIHFRGHVYRSSVVASHSAFGTTTQATAKARRAKVTVTDAMDSRRLISFVLDCSASMNDRTTVEAARTKSGGAAASKFDAARSALYEMMRRLSPTTTEVGLVMYGHRMAISATDQELLLQKRYHQRFPFPATVQPFADVEVALPSGRFDEVELDLARQHFESAVPWGQTPLYLAIAKAIDDASRSGNTTSKDVIVISDGRNYQFNPTPDAIVSPEALIAKAKQSSVRVHVIGFGLPAKDVQVAASEFSAIAEGTGGSSVTDVKDATGLLQQLESLAAEQTFTVQLAGGKTITAPFGETLELDTTESNDKAINVIVAKNRSVIPISPGDHLMLVANQMQDSLSTKPYLAGAPKFVNLVASDGTPLSTRLGVQVPTLHDDSCWFRVSLQRADGKVVRRPRMIWMEVHPTRSADLYRPGYPTKVHSAKGQQPTKNGVYRIGSCRWLADLSCPVGEFSCLDWPSDATGYQLEAWVTDQDSPGHVVDIDSSVTDMPKTNFPGLPGIRYQTRVTAEGIEIGIEYEQGEVINLDAMLVVELEGADQVGSEHWYDDKGSHSFHRFKMPVATASKTIKLKAITIQQWKKSCIRSIHPLSGSMRPSIATLPASSTR